MIEKLIKEKSGKIVPDDMKILLNDAIDVYANEKLKLISEIFKSKDFKEKEVFEKLLKWGGNFKKELEEPTLFALFEY